MPRELTIAETAKQRSLRLPLDYYRRGDPLRRVKWWLCALAAVVACVYGLWVAAGGASARRQLSPGPVASVHASWNDDCSACHQDFRPLRADAFDWRGLLTSSSAGHSAADQACMKCHDEPPHHASASIAQVPGCAECHPDHRGTATEIRRAADEKCLGCHANFTSHLTGTSAFDAPIPNVTAFAKSNAIPPPHPDFRSLERDPGNIKFNHWLHLQPGIAPADAKRKLKTADAAANYRRYGDAAGLVQLDCAACHEPDDAGKLMRPIAYERHCGACHPLTVAVAEEEIITPVHGLTAARLAESIDGQLIQLQRQQAPPPTTNANESGRLPLIPGRTLGDHLAQRLREDVAGRRATAIAAAQAKCLQCHYEMARENREPSEVVELRPAGIPLTWLRHGRFDHSAHRHVDCRKCHGDAYAFEERDKPRFFVAGGGGSTLDAIARDDQQVMIAGIESCLECHAPRRGTQGGARHDCAECHDYHGRDEHLRREKSLPLTTRQSPTSNLDFQFVAHQLNSGAPLVGPSSCAASGCHGAAGARLPTWQTALTTFLAADPHAKAYDVLWTARGREMTRLLETQSENLPEREHAAALDRRCVGCHATERHANHALGVHCESCHGPAVAWQHTHYRTLFARAATLGFTDTKELSERAAACMPCHVGPSTGSAAGQRVDHDLIAAGHPRLAFEFRSYFESLPEHWDRRADRNKRPDDHHFQLWLAGQAAKTKSEARLRSGEERLDFAALDCFRCHHALASGAWRQGVGRAELAPLVRPSNELVAFFGQASASQPKRLDLAKSLLKTALAEPSWDRSLETYLAVQAIAADLPRTSGQSLLKPRLDSFGEYLAAACFSEEIRAQRQPTIYDSPTHFEPSAMAIWAKSLLEALEQATSASRAVP